MNFIVADHFVLFFWSAFIYRMFLYWPKSLNPSDYVNKRLPNYYDIYKCDLLPLLLLQLFTFCCIGYFCCATIVAVCFCYWKCRLLKLHCTKVVRNPLQKLKDVLNVRLVPFGFMAPAQILGIKISRFWNLLNRIFCLRIVWAVLPYCLCCGENQRFK